MNQPSVTDDAANTPAREAELLRAVLADRDVPCPVCGYNLRGLTDQKCPECGAQLSAWVKPGSSRLAWWVVGLIGLWLTTALPIGLVLFGIIALFDSWMGSIFGDWQFWIGFGPGLFFVGAALWWTFNGSRLRSMEAKLRVLLGVCCALTPFVVFITWLIIVMD